MNDAGSAVPGQSAARILGKLAGSLPPKISMPLVSVIVTAYNCELYVREALDSVLAQTYGHFECIVIDDCSSDGTANIVREFLSQKGDQRFRLLQHDANRGQQAAQITGFQSCRGTFVTFLDADDILFPDFLEMHLAVHFQAAPIAAMTCTDSATIGEGGIFLSAHSRQLIIPPRRPFFIRVVESSPNFNDESVALLVIPAAINSSVTFQPWYWTTQSFMMFRRDVLELMLPHEATGFRVGADYYLVAMVHALNTTILIQRPGGMYRLHSANHFAHATLVSVDQNAGDILRAASGPRDLIALASQVIPQRFERLASLYGETCAAQAMLSLQRRGGLWITFTLLRKRLSVRASVKLLLKILIGGYVARAGARLRGFLAAVR